MTIAPSTIPHHAVTTIAGPQMAYTAAGLTTDANWAIQHIEATYLQPDGSGTGSQKGIAAGTMSM